MYIIYTVNTMIIDVNGDNSTHQNNSTHLILWSIYWTDFDQN